MNNKTQRRCTVCGEFGHNSLRHNTISEKICGICHQLLPVENFRRIKNNYIHSICIKCDLDSSASRYRGSFHGKLVSLLCAARQRAKKSGVEFEIDIDFLFDLLKNQNYKCFYSGRDLTYEVGKTGVSIDRKDPKIGYLKSNVVLTQWVVNNMKNNLSIEDFKSLCRDISEK